jgi:hypothetical protein
MYSTIDCRPNGEPLPSTRYASPGIPAISPRHHPLGLRRALAGTIGSGERTVMGPHAKSDEKHLIGTIAKKRAEEV